ncbi:hypothetical protein IFM89_018646 [Coptis chinensis]|uniref:Uncharacterized protein n=1 Tax=Coptis chinensis TaxID=261450 RepID=A0A835HU70_9MAGN|nr:hypothetical protein IFM89_018646 [Coptis chinensis]
MPFYYMPQETRILGTDVFGKGIRCKGLHPSAHTQTGLIIAKSLKLAAEAKLLCKEIAGMDVALSSVVTEIQIWMRGLQYIEGFRSAHEVQKLHGTNESPFLFPVHPMPRLLTVLLPPRDKP